MELEDQRQGPQPSSGWLDACAKGDLPQLRQLLNEKEIAASTLLSLLDEAAKKSQTEIINFLFQQYPNVNPDFRTAYHAAVSGVDVFRHIYARRPGIVCAIHWFYGDVLQFAINTSRIPLLEFLLEHGADPGRSPSADTPRFWHRYLPIENAALSSRRDTISRLLIEHGATLQHTTTLAIAAGLGRIEIARYLIDAGADINYVYCGDPTFEPNVGHGAPLHSAVRRGNLHVTRLLLEHGARLDVVDSVGQTPLDIARTRSDTISLEVLLGKGQFTT